MMISFKKIIKKVMCFRKNNANIIEDFHNIFDYNDIIKPRFDRGRSFYTNSFYGAQYILQSYSGYKKPIKCAVEHGLVFTFSNKDEYKENNAKLLLVSSENRISLLRNYTDKKMYSIGPLIAYASGKYTETQIKDTKENLGKTLLVFPMHSIEEYHFCQQKKALMDKIDYMVQEYNFDTVLICVYFIDIQRGLHIPFLQKGWQVVSCGHRLNYDFMNIQKSLIDISDHILCQGYSSAIGYSGYFKKPLTILDMDLFVQHKETVYEVNKMWGNIKDKFISLFSDYCDEMNDEQYIFLDSLFGYSSVKNSRELFNIFVESE